MQQPRAFARIQEAVESWRQEKLREVKQLTLGQTTFNSTIPAEEAKKILIALEFDWIVLLEEIGLWTPAEIVQKEHYDKSERELELEDQITLGKPIPPECNAKIHTDYDGTAVRWGLTHPKESAADCCQACLDRAKHAKLGELKCNIWVYWPSERGCYSPDINEHKHQEWWLKHIQEASIEGESLEGISFEGIGIDPRDPNALLLGDDFPDEFKDGSRIDILDFAET
ncbi:uncharacterized protein LOC122065071 [Macadamia integrifolia]|uniref:uncharacterized protein LOC122065071 n=1 Tax=Macadamia integrifolia TaxID=60698 RepID=UPI001C4F8355|nr:uncharacterized protein LOC122065071 [Macadamia integrifolia]